MTYVHTIDDLYCIFCKHVVWLNFLNFHVIVVTTW